MIEISKYKKDLETNEYKLQDIYKKVINNPTAIASLLTSIDMLEENESMVIKKLPKEKKNEI